MIVNPIDGVEWLINCAVWLGKKEINYDFFIMRNLVKCMLFYS